MLINKKLLFNNHFAYIAIIIQIIFFATYIFAVINDKVGVPSYFFAIYFICIYLALLYGYSRFNKSIKISTAYAFIEILIFLPVIIILFPYHCGKCDEISQTINGAFYYLLIFVAEWIILSIYLKIVSSDRLIKIRSFLYVFPLVIIIALFFALNI